MTYWERLKAAAQQLGQIPYAATDRVDVWHDGGRECYEIDGRTDAQQFLAKYASCAELQRALQLAALIDRMCCMMVERGTIEAFYHDGCPSFLEQTLARGGTAPAS